MSPPPPEGRGKDGGWEKGSEQNRPNKSTRRAHTSRELRILDHSDKPSPKRVRRPTRGMDMDNSPEVTRESNMICPITCRCHNTLLDIREKTRVVSKILRFARKIWKNELIAIFGLTAAITKKNEISQLRKAQEDRNSDLNRRIHRNTRNRKTEHRQSRIRDVAEDLNLVPIVTGGFRTFCY